MQTQQEEDNKYEDGILRSAAQRTPMLSSVALFGKSRELLIEHAGELYVLRITRNGKLILTK